MKPKTLLPLIFLLLVVGGAVLVLFPGPAAGLEPTHDPYEPPTSGDYYTGDLAGTAFEFWGVTSDGGEVLIADMEDFNLFSGSVYYGDNELSNVYVSILCSYDTQGFVYNDQEHPLTLTGVIGVHDWTAYQIVEGGAGTHDQYDVPYSLFGFSLDPEVGDPTPDVERDPWVAVSSISISPSSPTADDTITVTASFETGYTYGGDVTSAADNGFIISSSSGLSAVLEYTVDGTTYTKSFSVGTDFGTCDISVPAGGVSLKVIADFYGATASQTKTFTVGAGTVPPSVYYWMGEYAADDDRMNYEKMSIQTSVSVERTAAAGTDVDVGRVYMVDNGDGSPHLFSHTDIDAWYNWAWFQVWNEYAGEDLPDEGILRTYLRAYVNIEGYTQDVYGFNTEAIQSDWSSTVGINLATAPGISGVGSQVAASAFGTSTSAGLPLIPTLVMLVGAIGFVAVLAFPRIDEMIRG